jgi:NTE family protein
MKALVFSGGGAKIHYHVGAARALLEACPDYDLFAGVSAGAIVAAYLAQYPRGGEQVALAQLESLVEKLNDASVFQKWPLGRLQGLWKPSFYSSAPLRALLRHELDAEAIRASGRKLRIGAVDLERGQFSVFDERTPSLHDAVLASSAFPGFLEPVRFAGGLHVDGAVRTYTPIGAAIEAGATEIDLVIASPVDPNPARMNGQSALHVIARALDLMSDEIADKDLHLAELYNELVRAGARPDKKLVALRIIRPKIELPIGTWDFDSASALAVREQGQSDAWETLHSSAPSPSTTP